ncbi:MAG: SCO family protein [Gammaproteobacteria bacterium]|jgi:protein SCO1|nr:SCO family protein [Gammaproteobacteria bacterium]
MNRRAGYGRRWLMLVVVAAFAFSGCDRQPEVMPSVTHETTWLDLWPQGRALPAFSLTDHHGQPFGPEQLQGHWTLMFVGYTYCPDICPTSLATLAGAWPALKSRWPELQLVFLSADPKRDSPSRLAQYIPYFNPEFIGISGDLSQIHRLADPLTLVFSEPDTSMPGYLIDHSASLAIIGPDAVGRGAIRPARANAAQLMIVEGERLEQLLAPLLDGENSKAR